MQKLPPTIPQPDAVVIVGAIMSNGDVRRAGGDIPHDTLVRICTRHADAFDIAVDHPINGLLWVPGERRASSPFDTALCRALHDKHAGAIVDLRDTADPSHAVLVVVNATGVRRVCCYSDGDPTVEYLATNCCDEQVWAETENDLVVPALRGFVARAFARLAPNATVEIMADAAMDLSPPSAS